MSKFNIEILNESTVLTDAQIAAAIPALQKQISQDFAPVWNQDADLKFIPKNGQQDPSAYNLIILDNSDQAGALGYHDLTPNSQPMGKVFAGTDLQYGSSWTVTVSHELLELLADPQISRVVQHEYNGQPAFYSVEVADAPEDNSFGYFIDGILVSDFVYPSWFDMNSSSAPYDKMGHIEKPFQILNGGYIGVWTAANGWSQITMGQLLDCRHRPPVGSRRERRKIPKYQWIKSVPSEKAGYWKI